MCDSDDESSHGIDVGEEYDPEQEPNNTEDEEDEEYEEDAVAEDEGLQAGTEETKKGKKTRLHWDHVKTWKMDEQERDEVWEEVTALARENLDGDISSFFLPYNKFF